MVVDDAIDAAGLRMTRVEPRPDVLSRGSERGLLDVVEDSGAALTRHAPVLLASARALVHNESDARDLVQTTLEIAARKLGDLRDPAALRPWLLTIQVREAFRLRRRLARLVRLNPEVAELPTSPGPNADVIALRTALHKLPPRARTAIVLHYLADLPVSEVARAMAISENTTKGHLKAGLARLREELRDD
ncbi:MAG TPA: sigma-70 family RNA polymerase sigma factor [Candidatus Limnocylindrales bacterium]